MLLTMPSARLPCSAIFSRLLVRLVGIEKGEGCGLSLLHLVEELDGQAREVVDEVERVLDLVGDARGKLAERCHFLSLDQARLCRLQLTKRDFGSVARRVDPLLCPLALGDVAVDQHEAAARNRVAANLQYAPVGPRPLEPAFTSCVVVIAASVH